MTKPPPLYYVIAERGPGDRLILASVFGETRAAQLRDRLAVHLYGYRAVTIEIAVGDDRRTTRGQLAEEEDCAWRLKAFASWYWTEAASK